MRFLSLFMIAGTLTHCKTASNESKVLDTVTSNGKVAVLLASHGDIDDADKELEDYIKVSFQKNVGIPLPFWTREALSGPAYALSVQAVKDQYKITGPTRYREFAQIQARAVGEALKRANITGDVFLGYNFAPPLIETVMADIQRSGASTLVVFNKGAQFSYASSGENMEDVLAYLHEHPEFDAKVIGYRQYSDDPRFRATLAAALRDDAARLFPGIAPPNICILMGSHGLPEWLINEGDPAVRQMLEAYKDIAGQLKQFRMYHGFLNDDFVPGAKWVTPKAVEVVDKLKKDRCQYVLLDGRLSFTTHHRATLYDMNHEVRKSLETKPILNNGKPALNWKAPKVVLAPNFDEDPRFADLIATLTKEALAGKGPVVILKEPSKPAKARGSVGRPGVATN